MKLIYIATSILLIHIILFISKLNLYYFENYKYYKKEYFNNNNFDPNNKGRKDALRILLLAPYKKNTFIDLQTELILYQGYIMNYYPELYRKQCSKLFWNNFFVRNNIPHPKLIGYNDKNKKYLIKNYDKEKFYISKPINGKQGFDIKKIKGIDIEKAINNNNNILIQEVANDCLSDNIRHFRYVSMYTGESFCLWILINKNSNKNLKNFKTSNHSNGAKAFFLKDFKTNYFNNYQNNQLLNVMKKLNYLHKTEFPNNLSIGWDLVVNCSNKNNFEIQCLEGNVIHSCIFRSAYMNCDKLIYKYRDYVKKFYNILHQK